MSITPTTKKVQNIITNNISKTKYQHNIDTPIVYHYEITMTSLSHPSINTLDSIEQEIINYVMQDFLQLDDTLLYYTKNIFTYPNNCIAIDFIERHQNPKTHTVIIWKKEPTRFYVFDPNNTDFSKEFIDALNIFYSGAYIFEGITLSEKKLYESEKNSIKQYCGYDDDPVPRDCTDLAIKIGFEINELQLAKIQIDDIKIKLVNKLTNNKNEIKKDTNHKCNYSIFDKSIFREQHSSNNDIRLYFNQCVVPEFSNVFKNIKLKDTKLPISKLKEKIEDNKLSNQKYGFEFAMCSK